MRREDVGRELAMRGWYLSTTEIVGSHPLTAHCTAVGRDFPDLLEAVQAHIDRWATVPALPVATGLQDEETETQANLRKALAARGWTLYQAPRPTLRYTAYCAVSAMDSGDLLALVDSISVPNKPHRSALEIAQDALVAVINDPGATRKEKTEAAWALGRLQLREIR